MTGSHVMTPCPSGDFTDFQKAPRREAIVVKPWALFTERLTRARGRMTNLPANRSPWAVRQAGV